MLVTQNLLAFNKGISQSLGILPQLPITLVRNTIYIDVMVFQGHLDFNLLLGCDHVYVMATLISSLFRVMCFLHQGRIMTIDQPSFIGPNWTPNQPTSLNVYYMKVVSSPPQINYVATYSMLASSNDLVGDVEHHLLGTLESYLSIESFETFQRIFLPYDEKLLETMASWR